MKVVAVVPCYNEEKHIETVLKKIDSYVEEIVVVDDGSNDRTPEIIRNKAPKKTYILTNLINNGKGAAARTGCDYAIDTRKADLVILLDGDEQHDPKDIPRFIELHETTNAEIVFGLRKRTKDMPIAMRIGNRLLTVISQYLLRIRVQDTQCGYRSFTRQAYRQIRWNSHDYAMETEMIARAGAHHTPYKEILIKTVYHDIYKGTTPVDGVKILIKMLKWWILAW